MFDRLVLRAASVESLRLAPPPPPPPPPPAPPPPPVAARWSSLQTSQWIMWQGFESLHVALYSFALVKFVVLRADKSGLDWILGPSLVTRLSVPGRSLLAVSGMGWKSMHSSPPPSPVPALLLIAFLRSEESRATVESNPCDVHWVDWGQIDTILKEPFYIPIGPMIPFYEMWMRCFRGGSTPHTCMYYYLQRICEPKSMQIGMPNPTKYRQRLMRLIPNLNPPPDLEESDSKYCTIRNQSFEDLRVCYSTLSTLSACLLVPVLDHVHTACSPVVNKT
ncbi:hypothetical protein PDE_03761 [Penicillium oxalicum 114-2]|uniref:Uncharacterized protein n=1 Tax=Penicillium oxalicum (strain 114-2 / CGMCC 5302) TaxID=933388 RepID=S7ZDU4_PENO1|nr:hypothetical protein PDE_03761 [Penicillium oxalicum 114-2]